MTATTHPQPFVLPGQAAAAPGPVDLAAKSVEHHAIRRDLARFDGAVRRMPATDRGGYARLLPRWRVFTTALNHHCEAQDTGLWPMLRGRVTDVDVLTLEAMALEHETVGMLTTQCGAWLGRLAAGGDEPDRRSLQARMRSLRTIAEHHLDHEECEAFPLVQRHLTLADWDVMDREHFQKGIAVGELIALAPWAVHGIPAALRDRALASLPRPAQVAWRFTHRGFERAEQRAFGPLATLAPVSVSEVAS
jgi:hemerythrin-like domain-containing protein